MFVKSLWGGLESVRYVKVIDFITAYFTFL